MTHTLLVTGGAGFIGSNFVRWLLAHPEAPPDLRVVVVDLLTYAGNLENLDSVAAHPRYSFEQEDIADRKAMRELFRRVQPTAVVNFAAESHVDRSIDDGSAFIRTNIVGTFELLEAARLEVGRRSEAERGAFRFLHVSTDEVYGSLGPTGRFTEATAYAPNSPYAASKAAADHLVRAHFHTYGLPTLVTNCSNNYGPFQFPEKLIPLMILNAAEGKDLPIYSDGSNVRDWIYVTDHVAALLLALERGTPGETYLIGARAERTNLEIVRALLEKAGAPLDLIQLVADRPGHDRRYAVDPSKAERELGFAPSVSLDEGLERTVAWYREHAAFCERVAHARQRRGLGRA